MGRRDYACPRRNHDGEFEVGPRIKTYEHHGPTWPLWLLFGFTFGLTIYAIVWSCL